jgi:hypothetical protein
VEPLIDALVHGPGLHVAAMAVLAVIAVITGLVYAVRSRMRSAKPSERDQGRGA